MVAIIEEKGMDSEEAGHSARREGTKKKGPAKRLSKSRRRAIERLKKL